MIIDVHCHLELMKNLPDVIKRAEDAGLTRVIAAGIDPRTNRKAQGYAKQYGIVRAAAGMYPEDAARLGEKKVMEETRWIENQEIIALSEIGLDFSRDWDKGKQEQGFRKMLELAEQMDVSVIVHSRKAEKRALEILAEYNLRVVMHCYNGQLQLAETAAKKGYYFSIPAIVQSSKHFQELVARIPGNRIVVESDSPFLGTEKGKQNEPESVVNTINEIAKIKKVTAEEMKQIMYMNCQKLGFMR